jgi:hypothetical protein
MVEAILVFLTISGCAVAHEGEEIYETRRLRIVMDRPESGEPTFVGFFDPEFDAMCLPRVTEDGALRCVPGARPINQLPGVYADPACTEPVDTGGRICQTRHVFEEVYADACGASTHLRVFEVSEEVESFAVLYQRSARTGECYAIGGRTARRVMPIPPRRMVRGDLELGSSPHRLVEDVVVWADGTRGPARIRDTLRGEECAIEAARSGGGPAVCAPRRRAYEGHFGPECTERWARSAHDACSLSVGDLFVSTDCDSVVVGTVGERVLDPRAFPECSLSYAEQVVYSTGPAPDGLLPWLRLEHRGEGRLQRRVWVDDDGREWANEWAAPEYHDSELGVDCSTASWSQERCLPTWKTLQFDADRLFADESCVEPAVGLLPPSPAVCHLSQYVWRGRCRDARGMIGPFATGAEPPALYRLGEPLAGPLYERDETTGACRPRHFLEDSVLVRLEPVDVDAFAVVHRVME